MGHRCGQLSRNARSAGAAGQFAARHPLAVLTFKHQPHLSLPSSLPSRNTSQSRIDGTSLRFGGRAVRHRCRSDAVRAASMGHRCGRRLPVNRIAGTSLRMTGHYRCFVRQARARGASLWQRMCTGADWRTSVAVTLPTFVVIGAMKAGTVSLRHYLAEHPDVFLGRGGKFGEPNFFVVEENWPRGLSCTSLCSGTQRVELVDLGTRLTSRHLPHRISACAPMPAAARCR